MEPPNIQPLVTPDQPVGREAFVLDFAGVHLPPDATPMRLLGVDYVHVPVGEGGDLYLTRYGLPYLEHLKVENWHEEAWFREHRERLAGTSTVYRVPTRVIGGRSIELVVKYCRVGEEVPLDTRTMDLFSHAEFNSPYEEFALVMELRERRREARVRTHRPLAIYVPAERLELWQTARLTHRIERKKAKFQDVELDIYRRYILIYEWIKGVSAVEAFAQLFWNEAERGAGLKRLTEKSLADLRAQGFMVLDHKPAHIILRMRSGGQIVRDRSGEFPYALVDFELLTRTPEHERSVQQARRAAYLRHQRDRFAAPAHARLPPSLGRASVFGVDYICGQAESTHGMLWVVGREPGLFDYFLPERWRHAPRKSLSETSQTFYTLTKDSINLVWKVSQVGERPEVDPHHPRAGEILAQGYNSPFEEFSIAIELSRRGVPTIYPRAIYRTGLESVRSDLYVEDTSRYRTHADILGTDGRPVLRPDHVYIAVWGFWNGLDEMLASKDEAYCRGIDLGRACEQALLPARGVDRLMRKAVERLAAAGFETLYPKRSHFLLSVRYDNTLIEDEDGDPSIRLCNFEFLRPRPRVDSRKGGTEGSEICRIVGS